jgi:hypothetical protein
MALSRAAQNAESSCNIKAFLAGGYNTLFIIHEDQLRMDGYGQKDRSFFSGIESFQSGIMCVRRQAHVHPRWRRSGPVSNDKGSSGMTQFSANGSRQNYSFE